MVPYRLVSSKAELLGNHQGLAEVVSRHLASNKPEARNNSTGPLFAERSVGHRGTILSRAIDSAGCSSCGTLAGWSGVKLVAGTQTMWQQ